VSEPALSEAEGVNNSLDEISRDHLQAVQA
jgi:hypothetical protein